MLGRLLFLDIDWNETGRDIVEIEVIQCKKSANANRELVILAETF